MPTFVIDSPEERQKALKAVAALTHHKIMQVEIKPRTRTKKQNDAYWYWMQLIEDATGTHSKAWHEYFKREFIGPTIHQVMGTLVEVKESTTDLRTDEFNTYIERIYQWCVEQLHLTLPEFDPAMARPRE
jgi:NinB protein